MSVKFTCPFCIIKQIKIVGFSAFPDGGRFEALYRTGPGRRGVGGGAGAKGLAQLSLVDFCFLLFVSANLKTEVLEPWE